jgi:hypothetical protein
MRDVTPVEALETKLACVAMTQRVLDFGRGKEIPAHRQELIDRRCALVMLTGAVPVAWSSKTFEAVKAAAQTYPLDVWPVVPPLTSLRLMVCPDNIVEEGGGGEAVRVVLIGFSHGMLVARGFVHWEGFGGWRNTFCYQVPVNTCIEEWDTNPHLYDEVSTVHPKDAYPKDAYGERPMNRDRRIDVVKWMFAAWAFLDQKIAVEERAHVDRAARKRAARLDIDPVVHVVNFRKSETRSREVAGPLDVEWSCQWLVRGHWRNQWHPRMQRHAPVWILPHIKGPADMPLKTPAPEVWQVAR